MFTGFEPADFDVFTIPGLDPRMEAIKSQIRPKLESLGTHFTAFLAPLIDDDVYAHVAKHARRTVNPPDDTWVAFSTNARGYKQHPHFQIGLWQSHVFVTFGYIYEAVGKVSFGQALERMAPDVHADMPKDYSWIPDHTKPEAIPAAAVDVVDIRGFATRLQNVKKAELLVGKWWSPTEVCSMGGEAFVQAAEDVMRQLMNLYRLGTSPIASAVKPHKA